jgi:cytochrome oxidase Cu insertion factor (SCO1/SenC/PrrC family)
LSPRLRWLFGGSVVALGALVGLAAALLQLSHRSPVVSLGGSTPRPVTWAAGERPAPDFRLTDQHGAAVSLAALRGRPVIVAFIDPLCRDFCPLEAKQLDALVQRMPAAERPAIVAVSVNVYGNARENLLQDVAKWRLVPEWRWGVGSSDRLARVWRAYKIGVVATTKKIAGVTVHETSHTEAAYVVDRRGFMRAVFLWPYRASDVAGVLRALTSAQS